MPSTRYTNHATHCKPNLAVQIALPLPGYPSGTIPAASATSATHTHGLSSSPQHENDYLCAWLRSRLEEGTWIIREESALTATESDRRQVTGLAHKARSLGLPVWPPRKAVAA